MFSRGYYTIAYFKGAPIRVHWSAPLGALVLGRLQFVPGFWLGFFLLILLHELGHAIVVRACGLRVAGIDVHGLGGACRWEGYPSQLRISLIAWGGVWAQLVVLISTYLVLAFVRLPPSPHLWDLIAAFTHGNLGLIAFNLLPIPPLDGVEAWPLFKLLWQRWKLRRQIRISAAPLARPVPKTEKKQKPKYSDRVSDPEQSEEYFQRLMQNNPVEEEEEER